jgi:hypothetical protein
MDLNLPSSESAPSNYLPEGSSRNVVRQELTRRAYAAIKVQFPVSTRTERRAAARAIAKDLWKKGERLLLK